MSTRILAAIRSCPQLHGNLKFTALEIAHRLNGAGYGRVAHQFMAHKTGYSVRTAFRHAGKLVAMGILAKTVYRTAHGCGINLYRCLLPIPAFYRAAPATTHSDSVSATLPPHEKEKDTSVRQDLDNQRKGIRFLTAGSDRWTRVLDVLPRLKSRDS